LRRNRWGFSRRFDFRCRGRAGHLAPQQRQLLLHERELLRNDSLHDSRVRTAHALGCRALLHDVCQIPSRGGWRRDMLHGLLRGRLVLERVLGKLPVEIPRQCLHCRRLLEQLSECQGHTETLAEGRVCLREEQGVEAQLEKARVTIDLFGAHPAQLGEDGNQFGGNAILASDRRMHRRLLFRLRRRRTRLRWLANTQYSCDCAVPNLLRPHIADGWRCVGPIPLPLEGVGRKRYPTTAPATLRPCPVHLRPGAPGATHALQEERSVRRRILGVRQRGRRHVTAVRAGMLS
jgi:hypothetical protein